MNNQFSQEYYEALVFKENNNTISAEEKAELDNWYLSRDDENVPSYPSHIPVQQVFEQAKQNIFAAIQQQQFSAMPVVPAKRNRAKWLAAAALLAITATGIFLYLTGEKPRQNTTAEVPLNDLPGGTNKAVLTRDDGSKVALSNTGNEVLTNTDDIKINRQDGGTIVYTIPNTHKASGPAMGYNTIETPAGGQYQVILPDGSHVWLNAKSSIRFPVQFTETERAVTITGEAYFKVTPNSKQPFRVVTGSQTIDVLGTRFNVNSYTDEPATVTTLENGAVKVTANGDSHVLSPGQQAISTSKSSIHIEQADLTTALAWINNKIYFKNADLPTIMRQVARWYNVDVKFKGVIAEDVFNGGISRNSSIKSVIDILQRNNIRCELVTINGKATIVVSH